MRPFRALSLLVTASLLALVGLPADAAPGKVIVERYTLDGVMAEASWVSEEETPVGTPRVITVVGADATLTSHTAGGRPQREPQVSLVAWAMMVPGEELEDEPVPAEVWAIADHPTFTYDRALSRATLSFDAVAEVFSIDENGEEVPTGETFPVSVTAEWTGVGPLATQRSHDRYTEPGIWVLDRGKAQVRPALAEVVVTSPDGVVFDGTMTEADISKVKAASLAHVRG
jgi:hypothetical protein